MTNKPSVNENVYAPEEKQWYLKNVDETNIHVAKDKLVCAKETHTVNRIIEMMYDIGDFAKFRHILVTKTGQSEGDLLGIVSLRDINRIWQSMESGKVPLKDVMTPFVDSLDEFYFVYSDSKISDAVRYFFTPLQRGEKLIYVSALPVLAPGTHSTIGIISYVDFINAMLSKGILAPDKTVKEIMQPVVHDENRYHAFAPVDEKDSTSDSFYEVAALIRGTLYRTIPVVDRDLNFLGIVTDNKVYITRRRFGHLIDQMKSNHPLIMYSKDSDYRGKKYCELITQNKRIADVLGAFKTPIRPDALVVVEDEHSHKLVGMLSYVDILKALHESIPPSK